MRNISVHKIRQPSRDAQFLVVDNTSLQNPEVLGKVEMTMSELVSSSIGLDNFKTQLKSKVYDLVVEKLGGDIEYFIKLDL